MVKEVTSFDNFDIKIAWQHFGNKKSVSQNKLCIMMWVANIKYRGGKYI